MELNYHFDTETFRAAWEEWKLWRWEQHKFKYKSQIGEQKALKSLLKESDGTEENAILLIDRSITRGWKGFFKYNDPNNGKSNNSGATTHPTDRTAQSYFDKINRANSI